MATNKPSIHKTLLILILVFTPPIWLLFTDPGARVSDRALLWLLGAQDLKLGLKEIDSDFTRADIEAVYSEQTWQCGLRDTTLGDSLCAAQIGAFNGFPAKMLIFYFRTNQVSAMKLIYRVPYHKQIMGHCIDALGQPDNVAAAIIEGPEADPILQWRLPSGTLLLKKVLSKSDEPALLWIARQSTQRPANGARL